MPIYAAEAGQRLEINGQPLRNRLLQPGPASAIFNRPIGRNAIYLPSGITAANGRAPNGVPEVTVDPEFIGGVTGALKTMTNNAVTPATTLPQQMWVPAAMNHDGSFNGCWAFVAADGYTVYQGQPLLLTAGGSPSTRFYNTLNVTDINTGDGRYGSHGGSGMSTLFGSLRVGELTQSGPIGHALKINLYGRRFLSTAVDPLNPIRGAGWRWPARKADTGFNVDNYPGVDPVSNFPKNNGTDNYYGGTNLYMGMGTLLAIPPTTSLAAITEPRARKVAECFRDFGAYVTDNTARNVHAVCAQQGAWVATSVSAEDKRFHAQVMTAFAMLRVVSNNRSDNIGGGGVPLAARHTDEAYVAGQPSRGFLHAVSSGQRVRAQMYAVVNGQRVAA